MRRSILAVPAVVALSFWVAADDKVPQKKEGRPMDRVIHLRTTLQCKPDEAFALFTDGKRLATWLTEVAEVEPKVGGRYELFWEPTDRENNSTIGCRVTAVEAGQLVAFEWKSPKQFKAFANVADPLTHVTVAFIPNGNLTEVHLVHSGWRSAAEWEEALAWQERAWRKALEGLAKQLDKR